MKISRKSLFITSAVSLLVIGATLTYLEVVGITNFIGTPTETAQEAKESLDKKGDLATGNESGSDSGKPDTNTDTETYTPPTTSNGITIDASQPSAQEVVVVTKLEGYSDGNCKLTATNGAKNTSQTAPVMFQREYSTCAGFTVPVSSLGNGSWNLLLEVTSGDITTSKSASLEVK